MKVDILLVEDNHDDAALALRVLLQDKPGLKIKHMSDGAEVFDYFFSPSGEIEPKMLPRVIFLDIKLPKLNGPELLKSLKSNDSTKHVPVVVMTSSKQQKDVHNCYSLGANSYVVKPIDFRSYQAMLVACSSYWLGYNVPMKG